jgi:type II secretory pathway pseudopilin PulG
MKKFFNTMKNTKGNSLAEFAVTAAMMATLATTAAPRFAGTADAAKAQQTRQNLDKIAGMINQFYMEKSNPETATNPRGEGKGRVPGQQYFESPIGKYEFLESVEFDLTAPTGGEAPYNKWNSSVSDKWVSVFGKDNVESIYLGGVDDHETGNEGQNTYYQYDEFNAMLQKSEGIITSPFKQGHYIYVVIPGGKKYYVDETTNKPDFVTCNDCGPIVVIADAYDPSKYHKVQSFN